MTTINLKDFYPWYMTDEYIEVSVEVAAELRASKLAEAAYTERVRYTRRTIPSTVTMGSSIPLVCMIPLRRTIVKQLVNVHLVFEVTEYHADVYYNHKTGERVHAEFPAALPEHEHACCDASKRRSKSL